MTKTKNDKAERPKKMNGADFKRWRKHLGLNQKEAAEALGLKRRVVQYYEKGERDGKSVEIPKSVRLACFALVSGQEDYFGPSEEDLEKKKLKTEPKPKTDKPARTPKAKTAATGKTAADDVATKDTEEPPAEKSKATASPRRQRKPNGTATASKAAAE